MKRETQNFCVCKIQQWLFRKSVWRYLDESNIQDTHARTFGHTQPYTNEICSSASFFCELADSTMAVWRTSTNWTISPSSFFSKLFVLRARLRGISNLLLASSCFVSGRKVPRVILFQSDACICRIEGRCGVWSAWKLSFAINRFQIGLVGHETQKSQNEYCKYH